MLVFTAVASPAPAEQEQRALDEGLFARIGAGEEAAFCRLYEQTSSAVFSYALSLLHNPQDAEDTMMDTYLKIRGAAHLYQPMGKPMAWIFTITRNLCMMRFRQNSRNADVPLEEVAQPLDFSQIQDREDRIVLETAFQVLSPQECQIIVLHAVSGCTHREISQSLGLPLSTALSKYNRGMKKLRKQLEVVL